MTDDPLASLKTRLEEACEWPHDYPFKFIMPRERLEVFLPVLKGHPFQTRESSGGKYTSVTCTIRVNTPDEVLAVYREAGKIDGVIML